MRTIVYNKLVRDDVVAAIERDGMTASSHIVAIEDRSTLVAEKIIEEARELRDATTPEDRLAERADIEEILAAYDALHAITKEKIIEAREQKNRAKGAFRDFVYLEKVTKND